MARLTVADNEEAVATASAERITSLVEYSIRDRGSAMVSLTGGTTPARLYTLLADPRQPWRSRIDWSRVHLFWGDERHVPPGDADSNFGMANRTLVAHVPIPPSQVHRMCGEIADAVKAAAEYEAVLTRGFAAAGRQGRTFDVMLLGLGEDAHIASVFPGSPLLDGIETVHLQAEPTGAGSGLSRDADVTATGDSARLVAGVWAPHLNAWRITLTPAAILDSRAILLIVAGTRKAAAVHAALDEAENVRQHPAQLLRRAGDRVEWIIDRPAAARLNDARPS
jgi:6-phosphogluconolactonase